MAHHRLESSTIVFMPHCDLHLYDNLFRENWSREQLPRVLLIANRLSEYAAKYVRSLPRVPPRGSRAPILSLPSPATSFSPHTPRSLACIIASLLSVCVIRYTSHSPLTLAFARCVLCSIPSRKLAVEYSCVARLGACPNIVPHFRAPSHAQTASPTLITYVALPPPVQIRRSRSVASPTVTTLGLPTPLSRSPAPTPAQSRNRFRCRRPRSSRRARSLTRLAFSVAILTCGRVGSHTSHPCCSTLSHRAPAAAVHRVPNRVQQYRSPVRAPGRPCRRRAGQRLVDPSSAYRSDNGNGNGHSDSQRPRDNGERGGGEQQQRRPRHRQG